MKKEVKIVLVNEKWWVVKYGQYYIEKFMGDFYEKRNPNDASGFTNKDSALSFAENKVIPYYEPTLKVHEYIPPSLVKKMESVTKENERLKDKACAFDLLDKLIDADKRGDEEQSRLISEELEAYWQEHGRTVKKGWFARIIERLAA